MLAFSGFNGFGQFGSASRRHATSFVDFALDAAAWGTEAIEATQDVLIAPSWSYTAYAYGALLLLRGFLTDAADVSLTVRACDKIKQLAACDKYCLALLQNGQVYKLLPQRDAVLQQIKFVAAVAFQPTLPQKRSIFGECKSLSSLSSSSALEERFQIAHVACGANITVAISNTNVVYNGTSEVHQFPRHLRVQQLLCGLEHALLLSANGDIYSWGNGLRGQLGQDALRVEETPQLVAALAGIKIICIAAGGWHSAAISAFGDLYTWGYNSHGQLGLRIFKASVKQPSVYPLPQIVDLPTLCNCARARKMNVPAEMEPPEVECTPLEVFAGARHTLLHMSCGAVYAAGWNAHGQLSLPDKQDVCDTLERVADFNDADTNLEIICSAWCTVIRKKVGKAKQSAEAQVA